MKQDISIPPVKIPVLNYAAAGSPSPPAKPSLAR